jgi:hypothetical protein
VSTESFVDVSVKSLEVSDTILQLGKASLIIINDCSLSGNQLFKLSDSKIVSLDHGRHVD